MDFGITQQSLEDAGATEQTSNSDEDAEAITQGDLDVSEVSKPTAGSKTNVTPDEETDRSSGMTAGGKLDETGEGGIGPAESELEGENPSGQPFDSLMRSISETINDEGLNNEIIVEHDPNWITINISSSLLFANNSASILTRSRPVIATIANALKDVNNYVRVRGYTDNTFVPSAIYGNNWELSSRRAINVLQELETNGIDPKRLAAEAFGQYSPFYSNATRAGRAQNRRVVIAISREALKPETLAIVPGNSDRIIPTRRAGQGGFSFQSNTDGSVSFKAEPLGPDAGAGAVDEAVPEEAPPPNGDVGLPFGQQGE
ncbi:OmpA family protein [Anaerobiospirillum sp. NML120511]|uniref:OmpA/MotB family protein n=1 Tax=unclassified Anaerobiospirillum TaxID=2647410 RepID=UPI0032B1F83F